MKRNHTILVVDDEKTIADGLRLTLESEGYGVRTAGSVREALAAVVQGDSHAAIVDLMLPDGDGLRLRAQGDGGDEGRRGISRPREAVRPRRAPGPHRERARAPEACRRERG